MPQPYNPSAWDRYAYVNNNPISRTDPTGHCSIGASSLSPLGLFTSYASCVQDIVDAYNAYQSGETNPGALYLEATGIKDALVSAASAVHQMNRDVTTVFSNAPLEDRVLPSIHVGTFAVGTAASVTGGMMALKANASASGDAVFMSSNDQFTINASKAVPEPGYYDVTAHGSANNIEVMTSGGPHIIDHRVAARLIQSQADYAGQLIRLLSCSTGQCTTGFAQNLANKMGVNVMAPNDTLWAHPSGNLTIGPLPFLNTGAWNIFFPGG